MANCLDEILCENAFGCDIIVLDEQENPIDVSSINNGDNVIFVVQEKPGYVFGGWVNENGEPYYYEIVGENKYLIRNIDCSNQYYAKFCIIFYRVEIRFNSDCFIPRMILSRYGDIVNISAEESTRCRFLNWTKDNVLYSLERTFEYVVTSDTVFYANYDIAEYRITAKPDNRNKGVCTGSGVYEFGESVEIAASAKPGYYFVGWEDGVMSSSRVILVDGNKTYIAKFETSINVITIDNSQGGYVIGGGKHQTGSIVTLQAFSNPGWVFSYWEIEKEIYEGNELNFVASKNLLVSPRFEQDFYTVNFVVSPEGSGHFLDLLQKTYEYGEIVNITALPENGYEFVKWDDGYGFAERNITVAGDANYVAIFKPITESHQVSVVLNDATSCPIYVGSNIISQELDNNSVCYGISGTQIKLAPIIPNGKRLVSVTNSDSQTVWVATNKERTGLIPYTIGDTDEILTLNFEDTVFSCEITISPLNEDISGTIVMDLDVDGTYQKFTPTLENSKLYLNNISYGSSLSAYTQQSSGDYTFLYWRLGKRAYSTQTLELPVTNNLKIVATYVKEVV